MSSVFVIPDGSAWCYCCGIPALILVDHNTPGFDGLWDLSLSLDIVRTMRAFELLWGGSPTVFPPHRQTQPRGEREHRQSASLPKRDRKSRFREYWIEKRCEERDINPKKCGYDEAQEFCCPFLGTSKVRVSNTLHDW